VLPSIAFEAGEAVPPPAAATATGSTIGVGQAGQTPPQSMPVSFWFWRVEDTPFRLLVSVRHCRDLNVL
jgi:hypothetical protein